ncbi:hypothetical protein UCRPC4_g02389 [Phaeomoniella chlamydospora]|uniref:DUF221-domain-containing protein n=1 Tax=Phaeomoniella chlamydospora TaxID=158046 RepID=A0A0G2EQM5_PHACM|nr:hypothetical protein UCRPC4_g02389 [Phaeomoniella chlamydospora]
MANITSIINGGTGSAQHKVGTTIQTFAISLAAGFILFGVQFGAFIIVRNYLWSKRIYQPRAFLVPLKSRVKPPPNNPLKWILTVFKTPEDPEILQKAGIDAYFFMRFLAMCLKIFFPMAVIILPILIPLNFSGGKDTKTIGNNHYNITGLGLVVWVCYIFHLELMHYILKRQEFLSSPSHRLKASSTTVLITDIPKELCNFDAIMGLYGDFPGGVRRIWINRDLKSLVDKVILQHQLRALLETAETDLIRKAIKAHRTLKKGQNRDVAKQEVQTGDGEVAIELLPSERMSEYSPDNLLPQQPGTLPPVIQVILLSGPLPIILRALTNNVGGAVTASEGERSLQLWYFIFLVIELFIIPTISSGLTSIVENILNNPFGTSIPNILATNMPTAANYYFSFLVVQALSISASSILQTVRLFNYYVLGGAKTPHSVFDKLSWTNMTRIGSNIPWYTTFAVIGLVYSVIAPLILVFMVLTFGLFWIVIKNNLLYVVRTGNVDGGGLFFPKAINQLFFGLYCMEVCLIGLFFLAEDIQGNVACKAQGIIMSVTLLVTACYHMWLNSDLNVLYKYAPVRLQGVGLALNQDYENESSSDPLASGTDRGEGDQRSPSAFGTSDPNNADTDRVLSRDYEKSRSLSPHPLSKIPTHSRRVEEQQRRDRQSAKEILARINRPLDEARLLALENRLIRAEVRGGNRLVPRQKDIERQMMDDPISKIIMQHNDELEDLDAEDRDMLTSVAFTHPILREPSPSVWIPSDDLGVSDDEVKRTVDLFRNVSMSNKGAFLNKHLKVRVKKPPPDMSEFALVMAEL